MKNILFLAAFLFCSCPVKSQEPNHEPLRFIEVTGSAELEIEPDEIRLIIGIEEYWKEEFEKRTEFEDYKTKIPMGEIEKNLLTDLATIGIQKENIIIREVGNYWRYKGKEFLISKQLELILHDFKKVNEIISVINTKGISYMRIGELKNKEITEYRKQVKIEALKAAKSKAAYLLSGIDKQLGDIISIVELTDDNNYRRPQPLLSNTMMATSEDSEIENFKKIKLRYEIKAKFEIK